MSTQGLGSRLPNLSSLGGPYNLLNRPGFPLPSPRDPPFEPREENPKPCHAEAPKNPAYLGTHVTLFVDGQPIVLTDSQGQVQLPAQRADDPLRLPPCCPVGLSLSVQDDYEIVYKCGCLANLCDQSITVRGPSTVTWGITASTIPSVGCLVSDREGNTSCEDKEPRSATGSSVLFIPPSLSLAPPNNVGVVTLDVRVRSPYPEKFPRPELVLSVLISVERRPGRALVDFQDVYQYTVIASANPDAVKSRLREPAGDQSAVCLCRPGMQLTGDLPSGWDVELKPSSLEPHASGTYLLSVKKETDSCEVQCACLPLSDPKICTVPHYSKMKDVPLACAYRWEVTMPTSKEPVGELKGITAGEPTPFSQVVWTAPAYVSSEQRFIPLRVTVTVENASSPERRKVLTVPHADGVPGPIVRQRRRPRALIIAIGGAGVRENWWLVEMAKSTTRDLANHAVWRYYSGSDVIPAAFRRNDPVIALMLTLAGKMGGLRGEDVFRWMLNERAVDNIAIDVLESVAAMGEDTVLVIMGHSLGASIATLVCNKLVSLGLGIDELILYDRYFHGARTPQELIGNVEIIKGLLRAKRVRRDEALLSDQASGSIAQLTELVPEGLAPWESMFLTAFGGPPRRTAGGRKRVFRKAGKSHALMGAVPGSTLYVVDGVAVVDMLGPAFALARWSAFADKNERFARVPLNACRGLSRKVLAAKVRDLEAASPGVRRGTWLQSGGD